MQKNCSMRYSLVHIRTITFITVSALAYAQLGDSAKARQWLARAIATGFPCYPWFQQDQLLQPMQGDAEYERMLTEIEENMGGRKGKIRVNVRYFSLSMCCVTG